jgi:hypothetical protein
VRDLYYVYLSPKDTGDLIQGFVVRDAADFRRGVSVLSPGRSWWTASPSSPTRRRSHLAKAATFLYESAARICSSMTTAHAPVKIAHFDTAVALKANDLDIVA